MNTVGLYYFLGKCLVMDGNREARQDVETGIRSGQINWEQFVWMGSSHLVLPALFTALKRAGLLFLLPADLTEYLEKLYTLNLQRNRKIMEQSHEIIRIFDQAGIGLIFLKGAAHLLQGLYHDPGDRIMLDIDILVKETDLRQAARALSDQGYYHPEENNDDYAGHHHLPVFRNDHAIAGIELHLSPGGKKYAGLVPTSEVFNGRQPIEKAKAWVMNYRHQMILNFIHDPINHQKYLYRTVTLKGLYDFILQAEKAAPGDMPATLPKYNNRWNNYCCLASATFNHSPVITCHENRRSGLFIWQIEYYINNPRMHIVYKALVYNTLRLKNLLYGICTAPFLKRSRRYLWKKLFR